MPTLWDIITDNSTLPVQAGNTFWDHIQNQQTGGAGVDKTFLTPFKSTLVNNVSSKIKNNVTSKVSNQVKSSKVTSKVESKAVK